MTIMIIVIIIIIIIIMNNNNNNKNIYLKVFNLCYIYLKKTAQTVFWYLFLSLAFKFK